MNAKYLVKEKPAPSSFIGRTPATVRWSFRMRAHMLSDIENSYIDEGSK